MSTLKKDKQKVLDEVWTEERIKNFLDLQTVEGIDPDFHCLLRSYQSMKLEDFEKFVGFFKAAGRNLNARNPQGQTVHQIVSQHRHGVAYARIIEQAQ